MVKRPWGSFDVLLTETGYQVKRLQVDPGSRISLQLHNHRSEHWVVVEGIATVTIGEDEFQVLPGQSVDIHTGVKHRLANTTNNPLTVIEVQRGSYLSEDDIVRFDDDWFRS